MPDSLSKIIIGRGVVMALLLAALILSYVAGVIAAYVQMVLALILVIWVLFRKDWVSEITGTMLLGVFVVLLALFTITNPPGRQDHLYALNFWLFLVMGPLIAALSQFASPRNMLLVARIAFVGTVVALGLGIMQVYGLNMRYAEGYGANRINTAGVAIVLSFVASLGFFAEKSPRRALYLLAPVLVLGTVLLAGSRGPVIVYLALFAVLMFTLVRRPWIALLISAIGIAIALALLLAFPSVFGRVATLPKLFEQLATGEELGDNSARQRLRLYLAAVRAFLDSPWIGHGWGEKAAATWHYYEPGEPFRDNRNQWHLHSDVLNFAVAGGIAGLLAYATILLAPIVGAYRSVRDSQWTPRMIGAVMLSTGYAAYGAFNLVFGFEYIMTFYIMVTAILIGFCRDAPLLAKPAVNRAG